MLLQHLQKQALTGLQYYFYVTKPQVFGPSIIAIVTLNVIVGYELQVHPPASISVPSNNNI